MDKKRDYLAIREITASYIGMYLSILISFCIIVLFFLIILIKGQQYRLDDIKLIVKKRVVIYNDDRSKLVKGSDVPFKFIPYNDISSNLIETVLAIEDQNFFFHRGINPISVLRAAIINLNNEEVIQGGSTISQQLAKNLYLNSKKTLKRKIDEVILAILLEERYDKKELLELYLNIVYFGAGAYGINDASNVYFNKKPSDLNYAESAVLAGLLKAPTAYSPLNNLTGSKKRAKKVLQALFTSKGLNNLLFDNVLDKLTLNQKYNPGSYVYDYISHQVKNLSKKKNYFVTSTINSNFQFIVEDEVKKIEAILDKKNLEIAVVLMHKNGNIKALVGGKNYSKSEFNRAVNSQRQLGSIFKIVVFATAIKYGLLPYDEIVDEPINIKGFSPKNYNNRYYGRVSIKTAFAKSLNSVSVKLLTRFGEKKTVQMANKLKFASLQNSPGPALALGVNEISPLELAKAMGIIANRGVEYKQTIINNINYSDKQSKTLEGLINFSIDKYTYKKPIALNENLLTKVQWDYLYAIMNNVVQHGTGKRAKIKNHRVIGKTGTTQAYRDAWFAGITEDYVCIVWIGKDVGDNKLPITGGELPAETFANIMARVLKSN